MRRRDVGVIMKSCVAALSAAVVLTAMPAQVNAAPTKSVTVSTQKSLNAALKNSKVGTINIKTSAEKNFSIPKGKYTSKSVVMTASKASLTNNGTLKGMTIKSAKIVTEKADNNKINITDKGLRLIVAKGADNSKVSIGTKDAKVTVVADGKVASVSVNKKALVAVIGKTTKPVSVTSTVAGTGLILASKANVSLKNSTNVDVRKGADLGTVTAYDNASLKVAKGAKIATFNSTGDKASVKLVTNGAVGNVVLKKKATVTITGEPTKKVAVTNNASGSLVKLSVSADVKATQPTTVNAYKGSEIGKVTATKDLVLNVGSGAKVDTVLATKAVEVNANKGSEVGTVTGSMDVEVNVAVGAKVDTVKSQGEDAKVTVSANGTVGDVVIEKKADVKVAGTTTTPVNVTSNAADSVVSVSAASKITLNESATVNVAEGAKVESLTAVKDVAVTVDAKAEVAEVVVKGEDAKVDVTANGTVGAVTVDAKAEVSIKGETDSSVVVNANVESAKINTEVKTEVNANANVDITLGEGAEGSKVVAGKDVNASVKNETKEDVTVTDSTGKDTTVDSGSTGDTKPAPTPTPAPIIPSGPSYSTYYVDSKTKLQEALNKANDGDHIVIAKTIGNKDQPTSADYFGNYDINKAVTITSSNKQQVYGTFTILTDGVTINNLTITNRGDGDDKEKNAINIVASEATVTKCIIKVQAGHFGNGMCIYPTTTNVNYNIKENTFGDINKEVKPWISSAIILSEGYNLYPRFEIQGISANLVNEINLVEDYQFNESSNWNETMDEAIATGNTFNECGIEYVHNDYYRIQNKIDGVTKADYVYDYCVDGSAETAFAQTNQMNAKMVIVTEKPEGVTMDCGKTFKDNVTIEVRKGKLVIGNTTESSNKITLNGKLIINQGATLEIKEGCTLEIGTTGSIENNGTITNNGTIKYGKSGLKNLLEAASQYQYNGTVEENGVLLKAYEYKSKNVAITEDGNTLQIVSTYDETEPATIVTNFGDDMPRFLGAIYRSDGKNGIRVVNEIVFNGVTYVWKPERKLQGSNWCQKNTDDLEKTLVSDIKAYFMEHSTTPITIKIGDIDVQFVIRQG